MAETVVDVLEVIDIHIQQREGRAATAAARQSQCQALVELTAVRQSSEAVHPCEGFEFLLAGFQRFFGNHPLGDIAPCVNDVRPPVVVHRRYQSADRLDADLMPVLVVHAVKRGVRNSIREQLRHFLALLGTIVGMHQIPPRFHQFARLPAQDVLGRGRHIQPLPVGAHPDDYIVGVVGEHPVVNFAVPDLGGQARALGHHQGDR